MNKFKSVILLPIMLIAFMGVFIIINESTTKVAYASTAGWGDFENPLTDTQARTGNASSTVFDTPLSFEFNTGAGKTLRTYYSNKGIDTFYESLYLDRLFVYTWCNETNDPDDGYDLTELNHLLLYENHQTDYGNNGDYLVDEHYSNNLKLCSQVPNSKNAVCGVDDYGTGNMIVQEGKYEGKHYEWRYMGYMYNGVALENPYFPNDGTTSHYVWDYDNYADEFWKIDNLTPASPYAYGNGGIDDATLQSWYEDYLFADTERVDGIEIGQAFLDRAMSEINPDTGKKYTRATAWEYWRTRSMWEIDPDSVLRENRFKG